RPATLARRPGRLRVETVALGDFRGGRCDFLGARPRRRCARFRRDDAAVEKLALLAPLALTTTAFGVPVGGVRPEPAWSARLVRCHDAAAAVALAEGASLTRQGSAAPCSRAVLAHIAAQS